MRFDLIAKGIEAWPHIEALLVLWRQAEPHVTAILRIFTPVVEKVEETKMLEAKSGQAALRDVVLLPGAQTVEEEMGIANRLSRE